jgi:uncharacterized membrane protein YhaH (DUF805 family)
MSFQDAVRTCLTQKYATFSGRARRSEFWWFVLFNALVSFVASIIDSIIGTKYTYTVGSYTYSSGGLVQSLAGLALLLPYLAVTTRRLHDSGKSALWWLLWIIPPVGAIAFLIFGLLDSGPDNRYGPNPKGLGSGSAYQEMPPPAAPQY